MYTISENYQVLFDKLCEHLKSIFVQIADYQHKKFLDN